MNSPLYIGVDPGVNGGLVSIQGKSIDMLSLKNVSDLDIWKWIISKYSDDHTTFALIEQQVAGRPTLWQSKETGEKKSTTLRSTSILYGSYCKLQAFLVAAGISYEEISPRFWMGYYGLKKEKGEKQNKWKGRIKDYCISLYKSPTITLATCDALLIATYCKKMREGSL